MSTVNHWADAPPEAREFTEAMDEVLATTTRSSEELLDRARNLRAKAEGADNDGFRGAYEMLARRLEHAAAERVANA